MSVGFSWKKILSPNFIEKTWIKWPEAFIKGIFWHCGFQVEKNTDFTLKKRRNNLAPCEKKVEP